MSVVTLTTTPSARPNTPPRTVAAPTVTCASLCPAQNTDCVSPPSTTTVSPVM
jgi:hypothetical protein